MASRCAKRDDVPTITLISIVPSHFCEKARWALEFSGVEYKEQNYAPVFHSLRMALLGGGTTPTLIMQDKVLKDSTEILKWLDAQETTASKLYPQNPELCSQAEAWEELFDTRLGPATRRVAYFYLIDAPELFYQINSTKLGAVQKTILRALQSPLRGLIRKGLRVNAVSKQLGDTALEEVLLRVEDALSDGRKFLVGEQFSAADLTFASLLSPLLGSETLRVHRGAADLRALWPQGFLDTIEVVRARPAGKYALRIIDTHRSRPPSVQSP